jgi:plasmid stability protein
MKMATITVKNIPDDLYEQLKTSAEMNRRSINSEVIVCIERAVATQPVDVADLIARARSLRTLTAANPLDEDRLQQIIEMGRP